jgi:NADH-quinone oxidoreductase subunit N
MFPPLQDLYRFAPELVACFFGTLIMLADALLPPGRKAILGEIAVLGSVAALASIVLMDQHPGTGFYGLIRVDDFSVFLHLVIFAAMPLVLLPSLDYLRRENLTHGEYYALMLFASAGMGVMAGANELLTAFIGLEISSISSYILACYRRDAPKSHESALKYFLLGSFATAFFLYGVAMVYGATGTTSITKLQQAISGVSQGEILLTLGLGMMLVGLAFKIAIAPFQVWTPDVYEGAPTPVTAMLASAPKAAAFAVLLRIIFTAFGNASDNWFWVVWVSAALTMVIGNLAAVVQTNVKRMLAYSSIAHAGYLLVAIAARNELGIAAVLFYLVTYALMKLGAFTVVSHLGGAGEQRLGLNDFAGLSIRQPGMAAFFTLFLLSLLGLPLTAGFFGKYYIFIAALDARLFWLVLLMAVMSVVGAFYYLRVIWVMYFQEEQKPWPRLPVPSGVSLVLALTALGIVALFFFPDPIMSFARESAQSIR